MRGKGRGRVCEREGGRERETQVLNLHCYWECSALVSIRETGTALCTI